MSLNTTPKKLVDTPYRPPINFGSISGNTALAAAEGSASTRPHQLEGSLRSLHEASTSTPYPNDRHASREKEQNNLQQSYAVEIKKLTEQIKQKQAHLKKVKKTNDHHAIETLTKRIKQLKQQRADQRKKLIALNITNSPSPTNSKDSSAVKNSPSARARRQYNDLNEKIETTRKALTEARSTNQEKLESQLETELAKLIDQRDDLIVDAESSVEPPSTDDETISSSEESTQLKNVQDELALAGIEKLLTDQQKALKDAQKDLLIKTRAKANQAELDQCQKDINTLQKQVAQLENVFSIAQYGSSDTIPGQMSDRPAPPSPDSKPQESVAEALRRTRTGRRRTFNDNQVNSVSTTSTPLKELHDSTARNSALFSREDLRQFLNPTTKKKLDKLDKKIDAVAMAIDAELATRTNLIQQRKNSRTRASDEAFTQEIRSIDQRIRSLVIKLGQLSIQVSEIENAVLPRSERLLPDQKKRRYEALLATHKSEQTAQLEKIYQEKLSKYESEVLNSYWTDRLSMLGGAAANFGSFLLGNLLTRVLAGPLGGGAAYFGGAVGGALHGLWAGAISKQVAAASRTAPALVEFSNYWKLLGASWGDYWRDEKDKRKYASKDPENTRMLTIDERRAEERRFWTQLRDRFLIEELPYFSYTLNYTGKAIYAGAYAQLMASKSFEAKAFEGSAHSALGLFSAAETMLGIQLARGYVPKAEEVVYPSREIHQAHADMLRSLLQDLQKAYTDQRGQASDEVAQTAERDLLKAIHRIKKALSEAETKSWPGGTIAYELMAQFKTADAMADTLSEMLGRAISIMPSAVLSNGLADWRTSGDPWETFGGHALPALLLIAPPGWSARSVYAGLIRALMQAAMNGRSPDTRSANTVVTSTADLNELHDSIVEGTESSSYLGSEFEHGGDPTDTSIVIDSVGSASSDADSDDEWMGNPTKRGALKDD